MFENFEISPNKVNPKGGINFIVNEVNKLKLTNLIDGSLGERPKQAKYKSSDFIMSLIYSNFCGATRLEHTAKVKFDLEGTPNVNIPSSDRISWFFRKLATEKTVYEGKENVKHEFCYNDPLNNLMLDVALKLDVIKGDILDYDNTIIFTEKYDSQRHYKKERGYQPAVGFIDETPVYIDGRNGNTPAMYRLTDSVKRCLDILEAKNIKIKYFRSDSAGYQYDLVNLMEERNLEFFLRINHHTNLKKRVALIENWEYGQKDGKEFHIGEMEYAPFKNHSKNPNPYRAVVKREVNSEGKITYYTIMTNNASFTKMEAYQFYCNRGASELNFKQLNHFNWSKVPFSFLNENLVFLFLSGIGYIVYDYMKKLFSKKLDFIEETYELPTFRFLFIDICTSWVNGKFILYPTYNDFSKILKD